MDHRAMRSKFRYLSKFTAASRGFYCDSNAFELSSSINHGKITVLNQQRRDISVWYPSNQRPLVEKSDALTVTPPSTRDQTKN